MLSYKKLYYDSIDKMAKKIADNFVAGAEVDDNQICSPFFWEMSQHFSYQVAFRVN